nr:hypothetical protein CFP56_20649 [Quercus suber]
MALCKGKGKGEGEGADQGCRVSAMLDISRGCSSCVELSCIVTMEDAGVRSSGDHLAMRRRVRKLTTFDSLRDATEFKGEEWHVQTRGTVGQVKKGEVRVNMKGGSTMRGLAAFRRIVRRLHLLHPRDCRNYLRTV